MMLRRKVECLFVFCTSEFLRPPLEKGGYTPLAVLFTLIFGNSRDRRILKGIAMEMTPEVMERRTHPRLKVREGAFAVLPSDLRLGPIEDISKGGLSFCYVPLDEPKCDSDELEIYFVTDGFNLKKIPFETVSDFSVDENLPFKYVERRRHCLKFGDLSAFQKDQLAHFMENYTENGF